MANIKTQKGTGGWIPIFHTVAYIFLLKRINDEMRNQKNVYVGNLPLILHL